MRRVKMGDVSWSRQATAAWFLILLAALYSAAPLRAAELPQEETPIVEAEAPERAPNATATPDVTTKETREPPRDIVPRCMLPPLFVGLSTFALARGSARH